MTDVWRLGHAACATQHILGRPGVPASCAASVPVYVLYRGVPPVLLVRTPNLIGGDGEFSLEKAIYSDEFSGFKDPEAISMAAMRIAP